MNRKGTSRRLNSKNIARNQLNIYRKKFLGKSGYLIVFQYKQRKWVTPAIGFQNVWGWFTICQFFQMAKLTKTVQILRFYPDIECPGFFLTRIEDRYLVQLAQKTRCTNKREQGFTQRTGFGMFSNRCLLLKYRLRVFQWF